MIDLKEELLSITEALRDGGIDYALCGGMAVALHGYPRATQDIDLIIVPDSIEQVRDVIEPLGFHIDAGLIHFKEKTAEEVTVWRISRSQDVSLVTIDFILAGEFLEDVWAGRQEFSVGDSQSRLWAVSLEGLKKMKRSSGRPQDLADLANLE